MAQKICEGFLRLLFWRREWWTNTDISVRERRGEVQQRYIGKTKDIKAERRSDSDEELSALVDQKNRERKQRMEAEEQREREMMELKTIDVLNRMLEKMAGLRVSVNLAADGSEMNDDEDIAAYLRLMGRNIEEVCNQMVCCLQIIKKEMER